MNDPGISFRKNMNSSYMVISSGAENPDLDFHCKMLKYNQIPGLLPFSTEAINGQMNFLYDISSKQAFDKVFDAEKLTYPSLKALVDSLRQLGNVLAEYLLDFKYVMTEQRAIFTNYGRDRFFFCYRPEMEAQERAEFAGLRELFNQILSRIDYDDSRAVSLAFNINRLVQSENFTLADLPIGEIKEEPALPAPQPDEKSLAVYNHVPADLPEKPPAETRFINKARTYFSGKSFSDVIDDINSGKIIKKIKDTSAFGQEAPPEGPSADDILKSFDESFQVYDLNLDSACFVNEPDAEEHFLSDTAALKARSVQTPRLVGTGSQQGTIINLDHFPFTIGKAPDFSDYCLDDPTVSRTHCRIYRDEDGYSFEDLNSTNGSFINGTQAQSYTRYPMSPGDLLRLSFQEFYFR